MFWLEFYVFVLVCALHLLILGAVWLCWTLVVGSTWGFCFGCDCWGCYWCLNGFWWLLWFRLCCLIWFFDVCLVGVRRLINFPLVLLTCLPLLVFCVLFVLSFGCLFYLDCCLKDCFLFWFTVCVDLLNWLEYCLCINLLVICFRLVYWFSLGDLFDCLCAVMYFYFGLLFWV